MKVTNPTTKARDYAERQCGCPCHGRSGNVSVCDCVRMGKESAQVYRVALFTIDPDEDAEPLMDLASGDCTSREEVEEFFHDLDADWARVDVYDRYPDGMDVPEPVEQLTYDEGFGWGRV